MAHNPRMPIRTITFDWGDTLASNHGMPYAATQRRAFVQLAEDLRALGGTIPPTWLEVVFAELKSVWMSSVDPKQNPSGAEFDFAGLMASWVAACHVPADQAATVIERCFATLTDTVIPFAETLPVLTDLKGRGYRIGILSHVPWPGDACRAWYRRHGLAGLVDFYSLSSEVGFIKPHPAHYQDTLRQADCAPHELLHVGDHPWRDITGGKAFGFRTALRLTEHIYPEEQLVSCGADGEILRLHEVAALAERLS